MLFVSGALPFMGDFTGMRTKYTAKWGVQLVGMKFQICSKGDDSKGQK